MNTFLLSAAFGCYALNDIQDRSPEQNEEKLLWIIWIKDLAIMHVHSLQTRVRKVF